MTIKGIIFDFDGTLADTFPLIFPALRTALLKFTGRNFSNNEISNYFGPSEDGILRRLVPGEPQAAMETYLAEYKRHHAAYARLFPGMLDLLKLLREQSVKLGIITGKSRESLAISLEKFQLREYFDLLVAGSPERSVKDVNIRQVVAEWGFKPNGILYVGDTAPDIIAAREAGVVPVGVYWSATADAAKLLAENPAVVFGDVPEFSGWILNQL